jgi:hypothetical protein
MFPIRLFVVVAALIASAAPAAAQRAAGPYSGVLGAASATDASHTFDLRGSLFGSWDDTLVSGDTSGIDPRFLRSGSSAGASGSLMHARRSSRFDWQSSGVSSLRMSGTQSDAIAAMFSGQTEIETSISRRVLLSGSGGYTYSPYYEFSPGLDGRLSNVGAFGGGFSVATAAQRNTTISAGGGLNIRLSQRDTLDANANARRFEFRDQRDGAHDQWGAGLRFSHNLTKSLGLYAGYGRTESKYRFAGSAPAASDSIDIGVGYGDTLTFSRRTALTFASSTAAVRWNDRTNYRINGTASLTQGFGRSGSASLSYQRQTEFDPGFREPTLTDTVSAGLNNQLGRRASWSLQGGVVRGGIGFESAGHYHSYNVGGGLNMAVTRRIGMFTDYSLYRYDVPAGSTVFTVMPTYSRQSVTAGLTLWVPLISERSSRDSR